MSNVAKETIIPNESGLFRVIFLYVGQGDATLLVVPDGSSYQYVLVDSNSDDVSGGIDILAMLKDLFEKENNGLDLYINTHPHTDHLAKIKDIYNDVGIDQLWHSGHKPGSDHKKSYENLEYVIKQLGDKNVHRLQGSRENNKIEEEEYILGDITYNVLAPAEYVSDDVEDEKPEVRYQRIHEQCGVIKFSYGADEKQILLTGDADYTAWTEHITDYHEDRLPATILSAAHHGSSSFFWKNSDINSDKYEDHIDAIDPTYVVVSAPKSSESKHNHPDKKAMKLYEDKVGSDNVFHLGDKRECIFVDIDANGQIDVYPNDDLVQEYGSGNGNGGSAKKAAPAVITKVDKKPMG